MTHKMTQLKKHTVFLIILILSFSALSPAFSKKIETISSELGLIIPSINIAIDAVYDKRLDNLVPGYKILNVVVINRSNRVLSFDTKKDLWSIEDNIGNKKKAFNHLKLADPTAWNSLSDSLRNKLDYPQIVRQGETVKVDLFFKSSVDLNNFKKLIWKSPAMQVQFLLFATTGKTVETKKEPQPPQAPLTDAEKEAEKKYGPAKKTETKPEETSIPMDDEMQEPKKEPVWKEITPESE